MENLAKYWIGKEKQFFLPKSKKIEKKVNWQWNWIIDFVARNEDFYKHFL